MCLPVSLPGCFEEAVVQVELGNVFLDDRENHLIAVY